MKKIYLKPTIKDCLMHSDLSLLAGSGKVTETSMGFGGDAEEGIQGNARRHNNTWGDDEE